MRDKTTDIKPAKFKVIHCDLCHSGNGGGAFLASSIFKITSKAAWEMSSLTILPTPNISVEKNQAELKYDKNDNGIIQNSSVSFRVSPDELSFHYESPLLLTTNAEIIIPFQMCPVDEKMLMLVPYLERNNLK